MQHDIIKRVYGDIVSDGEISITTTIIVTAYMMGDYDRVKEILNKKQNE